MGIPDHLTCFQRNLYEGQEATVRTRHGTTDWFKIGKGIHKAVYCHLAYLTSMQRTAWEMLGWMNHKLESRLPGEKYQQPQICRWSLSWQKLKRQCTLHGILQARIEWVAVSFSRGSSQPREWTQVSHIAGRLFTIWATREATDWFQIGKGISQGCILSPCLFNLYEEYIMQNAGFDEA